MKRLLLTAALALCCLCSSGSSSFSSSSSSSSSRPSAAELALSAKAAHHIAMASDLGDEDSCSATSVGASTLLTAAHCLLPSDRIEVDGTPARIDREMFDGADHVLLFVSGVKFDGAAGIEQREPLAGEAIDMWGNPGRAVHIHRQGTFLKTEPDKPSELTGADMTLYIFQLPIYPGDSGAGLIDGDNNVIAVVSLGNRSAETACLRLQFSPEQLRQIR